MRKVRTLIALIVALFLAGTVSLAVYLYLDKPKQQQQVVVEKREKVEPVAEKPKEFSFTIEKGMRAVTIQVENQSGMMAQIVPGDWVDLVATAPIPGDINGRVSRLLFPCAKVIELARKKSAGGRKANRQSVTLMLSIENAIAVATTDAAANFYLLLRNPEDKSTEHAGAVAFDPATGLSNYTAQQRDMKTLITPGKRAITLEVSKTDGVNGIFHPGDLVDILVTCPYGNTDAGSKVGETGTTLQTFRNSRILLQNIRVLASDRSLTWNTGDNTATQRVTLEVTPEDAEKLTVVSDSKKGKSIVRLISRNSKDHEEVVTSGQELLDLLTKREQSWETDVMRGLEVTGKVFYEENEGAKTLRKSPVESDVLPRKFVFSHETSVGENIYAGQGARQ